MRSLTWNHVAGVFDVMALAFLITEQLIGATILANLILIVLAGVALAAALLFGVVGWLQYRNRAAVVILAMSVVLTLYLVLRCTFFRVPAGYGP